MLLGTAFESDVLPVLLFYSTITVTDLFFNEFVTLFNAWYVLLSLVFVDYYVCMSTEHLENIPSYSAM